MEHDPKKAVLEAAEKLRKEIEVMKKRKAKSKERERMMQKIYKKGKKKAKKQLLKESKQMLDSKSEAKKTDGSAGDKKAAETSTKSAATSEKSQRVSAMHKPGTPLSKTVMRVRPGLKEDDIVEEVLHVQFENVSDRPPRNSACEYRSAETKWVGQPEELKDSKDYNPTSKHMHDSKMAGPDSFGTPLSSFSQDSITSGSSNHVNKTEQKGEDSKAKTSGTISVDNSPKTAISSTTPTTPASAVTPMAPTASTTPTTLKTPTTSKTPAALKTPTTSATSTTPNKNNKKT